MATKWTPRIRKTGKLQIMLDNTIAASWAMPIRGAISIFNMYSVNRKFGVVFEETFDAKAAQVEVKSLPGNDLHGSMTPLRESHDPNDPNPINLLARAIIRVPVAPLIGGSASRPVGEPLKILIALHEIIHACGLSDLDHTRSANPDAFATGFSVSEGKNPNGVEDQFQLGSVKLPPHAGDPNPHHLIGADTGNLIRSNWT
jgi:hypothetical protein